MNEIIWCWKFLMRKTSTNWGKDVGSGHINKIIDHKLFEILHYKSFFFLKEGKDRKDECILRMQGFEITVVIIKCLDFYEFHCIFSSPKYYY